MQPPSLKDAVLSAFSQIRADDDSALEQLRPLYAEDCTFEDPVQKVEGVSAFLDVNRRLIRRSRELSFRIDRVKGDDDEFFVTWRMHLVPRMGPRFELDGVTHIIAEAGKVKTHRDYWDLATMIASAFPGGQRILRALLKPIA